MARPVETLELQPSEQQELERRVRAATTSQRAVIRARIVLLRAQGLRQQDVATQLGLSLGCVNRWSQRFAVDGLHGLQDRAGRGRHRSIPLETVAKIVSEAGRKPPGRQRWSTRSLAAVSGVSHATVQRIWAEHDLKPQRTKNFKLSTDKQFEAKFWDVIGLYLDPPEKSIVLCCDEKTQCQALERTQPALPLGVGHVRTRTHDYMRHGTICLCAAMSYLEGKLIYRTEHKHTHVAWLRFLKQIERAVPPELQVHVIADNYATHKQPKVKAWLARRQRFHMHFTPTSSSWLNLVERFFADLTAECVRDGSFRSVRELQRAIVAYLQQRNDAPQPYRWKADGAAILAKIQRARQAMEQSHD